jgi:hypothetical protein
MKKYLYNILDNNLIVYIVGFTLFFIVGSFLFFYSKPSLYLSFGAEYESIAQSIVSGKGYSNPFFDETGSTAWMPPMLVFIQVLVFYFTNNQLYAFIILSFIKLFAYLLSISISYKIFQIFKLKYFSVFFSIFIIYFLFSPDENFGRISDLWVGVLLQILFIFLFFNFKLDTNKRTLFYLSALLFVSPLTNPSISFGFVLVIAFFYFKDLFLKYKGNILTLKYFLVHSFRHSILALAFIFPLLIWGIRNYSVFGKFIPTKSNMWFEFYQANVVDIDGCLSYSTVSKVHPISNSSERNEIKRIGEVNWLNKFENISKEYVSNNFHSYLNKVLNRVSNAFVFIRLDMDEMVLDTSKFSSNDLRLLEKNKMIKDAKWICIELSSEDFLSLIQNINFINKAVVYTEWRYSKLSFEKKQGSLLFVIRSLFMSIIITISFVFLFLVARNTNINFILTLCILYISFILPYIIISHQFRYQRPLFLIQSFVLFFVVKYLFDRFLFKNINKPN